MSTRFSLVVVELLYQSKSSHGSLGVCLNFFSNIIHIILTQPGVCTKLLKLHVYKNFCMDLYVDLMSQR